MNGKEIETFSFHKVLFCSNFGIEGIVAGTTSVTLIKDTFALTRSSIYQPRLTNSRFINLAPSVGNDIFKFIFENVVSINLLHSDGT